MWFEWIVGKGMFGLTTLNAPSDINVTRSLYKTLQRLRNEKAQHLAGPLKR